MGGEPSLTLQDRPGVFSSLNPYRLAAGAAFCLLAGVALTISLRRVCGALENPLGTAAMSLAGALTALAAAGVRRGLISESFKTASRAANWAVMTLTTLAAAAIAVSLCLPGAPASGMFLLCVILGVEESWAWGWFVRQCVETQPTDGSRCGTGKASGTHECKASGTHECKASGTHEYKASGTHVVRLDAAHETRLQMTKNDVVECEDALDDVDSDVLPDDVTQQLTRSRAADGSETLCGRLRAAFSTSQRTASVHVAFCPPFDVAPELEVEQIDGPEARIKTAQLLPYGVRLDLKLSAVADEPADVVLQFSARTTVKPAG